MQVGQTALADRVIAGTAHRVGSTHAPENTLAALNSAIAERAEAVEIDAQETADGEVVLLHDTDLRRVARVARSIWDMRLDELRGRSTAANLWAVAHLITEMAANGEEGAIATLLCDSGNRLETGALRPADRLADTMTKEPRA